MKKLYETITAENWQHGSGHNRRGDRMCLVNRINLRYWQSGCGDVMEAVRGAVSLLYPDRCTLNARGAVRLSAFNDHPETTIDDIIRVCKVADV